jgi:hypothetical protein
MAFLVSTKTDSRRRRAGCMTHHWVAQLSRARRACRFGRSASSSELWPCPPDPQDSQPLSNRDLTRDLRGWSITETLGFCTAGFAEIAKRVNQPTIRHLLQFWDRLVRLQICIDNFLDELIGAVDDPC